MGTTTIQVQDDTKSVLDHMKLYRRETYDDVIVRILEDTRELNEETKEDLKRARKEISEGRFKTHEQVGKELGLA